MPRKPKTAQKKEILEALTAVIRGELDQRAADTIRACDLLGRYYGLWNGRGEWAGQPPVIIMGAEDLTD